LAIAINSDVLAEMEIPEVYLSVLASHEVLLASQICPSPVQVYVVVLYASYCLYNV